MNLYTPTKLPSGYLLELVNAFNKFFITKMENIRLNISSSHSGTSSTKHRIHCPYNLSEFDPVTKEELMKIVQGSKNATCDLDPFPSELLKKCVTVLLPYLVKLFTLSLLSGVVPISFKHAMVKPLIKKPSLDPENLRNYRPISNLFFLSKILEKIVAK